jgi:conjugal transfer pilus assembly protein TrbC
MKLITIFIFIVLYFPINMNVYANTKSDAPIMIFVSFSMPDASIKGWMKEAEIIHAPVVIRGLINNSFKETMKKMAELAKDNHGGVQLDPTLFQRFHIEKVPAVVVSLVQNCSPNQTCLDDFDVIYGDVTAEYALTKISNQNDSVSKLAKAALLQLREASNA